MQKILAIGRSALLAAGALFILSAAPALAVDFGDDTSEWANDGECDDPRFAGQGMAVTLLNEDMFHDAADCQAGFDAGRLVLDASIGFGDDSGSWPSDGECDDPRFEGAGMATSGLNQSNSGRDATDCRSLYNSGQVTLIGATRSTAAVDVGSIDFGDDSSSWANNGECDDPRFEGPGTATTLLDSDTLRDATDCRQAFEAGRISLVGGGGGGATAEIDFGDDASSWANNGECDDPRFSGAGMAATLLDGDILHDATDCQQAYDAGRITLVASAAGDIDFGDDTGFWALNGECDDPRFAGLGMALKLFEEDEMHDASDCRDAFDAGRVALAPADEDIVWGDDSGDWPNDDECDDPRFIGPGSSYLDDEDQILKDASDCQNLFNDGRVVLR